MTSDVILRRSFHTGSPVAKSWCAHAIVGNTMHIEGWNMIDEERLILWREYSFTNGAYATTLVFRGADGLVVVSPGTGLTAREYDALRELGEVRALVANNALHHLGQPTWRARFPDAV